MSAHTGDDLDKQLRTERARYAAQKRPETVDCSAAGRRAYQTRLVNKANELDPDGLWPPDVRMRKAKEACDRQLATAHTQATIKRLEGERRRLKAATS